MAYQPMYNAYAGAPYGYPGYYPQTTAPMVPPKEYEAVMDKIRALR